MILISLSEEAEEAEEVEEEDGRGRRRSLTANIVLLWLACFLIARDH